MCLFFEVFELWICSLSESKQARVEAAVTLWEISVWKWKKTDSLKYDK